MRAAKRAHLVKERLSEAEAFFEDDLTVGVLTTTLPGRKSASGIRYSTLADQYEYFIQRTTYPGATGWHSMRGLNTLIGPKGLGATGGTHFMEFTYNVKRGWWNVHCHTLFYGPERLDRLKATTTHKEVDGELLLQKGNKGRSSIELHRLGFGPRYTLDYAESHELEILLKYSSKVAYVTKPFKAPKEKMMEVSEFLDSNPRLSRPFGRNQSKLDSKSCNFSEENFNKVFSSYYEA